MNINRKIQQAQHHSIQTCANKTNAYSFFNLLTSPQLLNVIEEQLPDHRERLYTHTTTLSLFMAQAMNSDASCQNTVDRNVVERVFNGLPACSTITGAYCKARQRLPTAMIAELVKQTGHLVAKRVSKQWQWRPVKLVDGTTIHNADTVEREPTSLSTAKRTESRIRISYCADGCHYLPFEWRDIKCHNGKI